jgi:hypothetical protein
VIRAVAAALVPVLAVSLAGTWTLSPPAALPARFALGDCRHVHLVDAETGRRIDGAEDVVLAPDGATLILSAQDRLDTSGSEGGLYAVSLFALGGGGDVAAEPLFAPRGWPEPFRPHGIAISPDGQRLAVINHVADDGGVVEVGTLGPDGWRPDRRIADPRLCRANDLDFDGAVQGAELLRVTLDRADCDTSLRDLAGGSGSVAMIRGEALAIERTGLDFPNGIEAGWVAETRAARLSGPEGTIPLPGGPDNLGLSEGRIVAALHTRLIRTGLYIRGWLPSSGSRIVAADPETGTVEVLFDDPEGTVFSGATVGVLAGDRLVAGSVRDSGLLYCEREG